MIWGRVHFENVSKAGNPPIAVFEQVMLMFMAIFGQAVLGLCELARRTDSACCRTTVGGKLNEVLATR
jgi:hypothetical protein